MSTARESESLMFSRLVLEPLRMPLLGMRGGTGGRFGRPDDDWKFIELSELLSECEMKVADTIEVELVVKWL